MKHIILMTAVVSLALSAQAQEGSSTNSAGSTSSQQASSRQATLEAGKHLFILSGQSNMAGLKPEKSFTPTVQKAFGEDGVIVSKAAWSGQPIRKWYGEVKKNEPWGVGHLYENMMSTVKEDVKDRKLATVTFVWMQGEADAAGKKGDVYEACFKGLLEQVKKDMELEKLNFVIGRISDCDMENKKYPHWTKVRDVQVKLAESDPNGAWVDTDDLNDDKVHKGKLLKNPMHYSAKGYKILGQRFAEKAIELIKKH